MLKIHHLKRVLLPMQLKPFCYNGFLDPEVEAGEVSVLLIDLAKCRPCLKFLTVSPDDSQNPEALKGQMEQFGQAMVFAQDVETLKTTLRWTFFFMKHVIFMNHLVFWVMRYFTPRFFTRNLLRNVTL